MDPALRELISKGRPSDEVEAILRLAPGAETLPDTVREVCGFGAIRTIRVKRGDITGVWSDPRIASLKAARALSVDRPVELNAGLFDAPLPGRSRRMSARRPKGLRETGRGVVVGVIDWGIDFAHPAFLDSAGQSRILAIWDQRDPVLGGASRPPQPYGYGQVHRTARINRALRGGTPYQTLGYHPGDADAGTGAHGTHVCDIAAGSPRGNGEGGLAPEADIVFVHLAADRLSGLSDLGNSVRIIEAVDFINRIAGDRPCVINMSLGRQGGAKSGLSLVERALDAFAESRANACIVQSAGNYFMSGCHASGTLRPGGVRTLSWMIKRGDPTENEMEIWYSNRDKLRVTLSAPGLDISATAGLGETRILRDARGHEIARLYNRAFEPNTDSHNCNIFIRAKAPAGEWMIRVEGEQIVDGRFDAWIERDSAGRRGQSSFTLRDIDTTATIGSIATGFNGLSVGAAHERGGRLIPAPFGSSGPTRDGRTKPDLVAPGLRVLAARSVPRETWQPQMLNTRMSGASQASPYVAGCVALCLEAGQGALTFHDIRKAVIGSCRRPRGLDVSSRLRLGAGMIDPEAAINRARAIAAENEARIQEDMT